MKIRAILYEKEIIININLAFTSKEIADIETLETQKLKNFEISFKEMGSIKRTRIKD
ncbi:hypothetical protein N480_23445 [Pseudoalteromonas luteoviolacea S2607]|uniref:Uncharacterized protein n=1 Tax=Pseudoalteromonas luteoviolacea S4060-1 TaxID=1365257 RepID=A0A167N2J0_9GAMM|nr:hypothetical protein N480_23445 [Pseudoalteromonas luteoviolacea S2607]KZN67360.1 hypothetical protein N478_17505 [Pseudoalteromonas luteoviolacea S4060-1]